MSYICERSRPNLMEASEAFAAFQTLDQMLVDESLQRIGKVVVAEGECTAEMHEVNGPTCLSRH